uniref:Uncharacterized protein MANES_15G183700 n=1 Tax=Rhizophora mucronata TaxID=61149 RepID=A0A2P2M0I9_RHIMU
MPNIFAGAVYQQRQKFSTMRSLPFLSPLSLACLYEDTVQIMNGTSTSSRVCTIHFLAKNSVFFGSKRNPVESSFLSFRNKLCLPRRCPLNSASQPSSSDRGHVVVEDDLEAFLKILPYDLQDILRNDPKRAQLLEVVLDLGRLPEARYLGEFGGRYLRSCEVSPGELDYSQKTVGEFGTDNRAGIEGTLHRISAIRSRKGVIVGMTCRVGRAVSGHIDMVHDLLQYGKSILFVGRY